MAFRRLPPAGMGKRRGSSSSQFLNGFSYFTPKSGENGALSWNQFDMLMYIYKSYISAKVSIVELEVENGYDCFRSLFMAFLYLLEIPQCRIQNVANVFSLKKSIWRFDMLLSNSTSYTNIIIQHEYYYPILLNRLVWPNSIWFN